MKPSSKHRAEEAAAVEASSPWIPLSVNMQVTDMAVFIICIILITTSILSDSKNSRGPFVCSMGLYVMNLQGSSAKLKRMDRTRLGNISGKLRVLRRDP